jgi:hypothetical protein
MGVCSKASGTLLRGTGRRLCSFGPPLPDDDLILRLELPHNSGEITPLLESRNPVVEIPGTQASTSHTELSALVTPRGHIM